MTSPQSADTQVLPLTDSFGRRHSDLRVSVTDRCSLRCSYCMPEQGLTWLAKDTLLTADELVKLIRIATERGTRSVRLTGGEPLLRPDIVDIVAAIKQLPSAPEVSLTTNAIRLPKLANALADAGLDRVNISLDSLDKDTFQQLAKRDLLTETLAGVQAAQDANLTPVKINTVLLRGVNDDEAANLLGWAIKNDLRLRFIEQMPLDPQHGWDVQEFVTQGEILDQLNIAGYSLDPVPRTDSAPADEWLVTRAPGVALAKPARLGIVASVSAPFCSSCNRMRITADGQFRNCLFAKDEADLRGPLRAGATDEQLAALMGGSVLAKAAGHGIHDDDFSQPSRPMSAIGG